VTQPALNFDGTPAPRQETKANPVKVEKDRLNAAAVRVLEYLKANGSAVNWQLATPEIGGMRAVGRIHELIHAGHDIRKEHVSGGTWRYRYFGVKGL
jgi:gamma-glutamyltranspeptidase